VWRRALSELGDRPFDEQDLTDEPLELFTRWFEEARTQGTAEPNAVALATATPDGEPSARMVLLNGVDERGLTFFTNYDSRKGGELELNPRAALLFHWPELGRQVRIEGPVSQVERAETEAYARRRARASQLSALASPQSQPVPDRRWLERRVEELDREHAGAELPVGERWGGYRLEPLTWEFWQHRANRLHDRFRYERAGSAWHPHRLAP
jgi:pyridoxamine 5'-phosphate oxidase